MKNTAFTRAQHDFLRGDYGRAIMGFGTALETGMDAARVHLPLGLAYFRNHDFMEAVAEFSRVLELRPNDDQVLFLRGMARFNAGDEAGAVSDLTAALDANPNRVAAYVGPQPGQPFARPRPGSGARPAAGRDPGRGRGGTVPAGILPQPLPAAPGRHPVRHPQGGLGENRAGRPGHRHQPVSRRPLSLFQSPRSGAFFVPSRHRPHRPGAAIGG